MDRKQEYFYADSLIHFGKYCIVNKQGEIEADNVSTQMKNFIIHAQYELNKEKSLQGLSGSVETKWPD